MNQIDLNGQHAIVTGGAQGIGRAVAERFLASGAKVSLWDRDQGLANEAAGELADQGEVAAFAMDVTEEASVTAALAASRDAFGTPAILVNIAGIAGPAVLTWD